MRSWVPSPSRLTPARRSHVPTQIETLVRTDDKRVQQWDEFKAWLDASGPFDVINDAANVGYFNQNFDGYVRCPCGAQSRLISLRCVIFSAAD